MRPAALALLSFGLGCNAILGIEVLPPGDGGGDVQADDAPNCQPDPADASIVIGTLALQPSTDNLGAGSTLEAFPFVASRPACFSEFHFYAPQVDAPALLGVYADNGGPAMLLARAGITSPLVGWNTAPLDRLVTVTVSQTLWLAVAGGGSSDAGATIYYLDNGSNGTTAASCNLTVDDAGAPALPTTCKVTGNFPDSPLTAYLR